MGAEKLARVRSKQMKELGHIFFHASDGLAGRYEHRFGWLELGERVGFRRVTSARGERAVDIEPEVDVGDDRERGAIVKLGGLYGFIEPDAHAPEADDEYIARWRKRFVIVPKEQP
jgi:cold shock CspA family protein